MNALEQLRGRLYVLRGAHAEGDAERVWGLLDALEDDLDLVERENRPARDLLADHLCTACESDCNAVVDLRRRARFAERDAQRLAFELAEEKRLKRWAA